MPWIPDSSLCQWNLDSGFQSLAEFRILWAVFRIPQVKISQIPESRIPYSGRNRIFFFLFFNECRPWPADWIAPECTVMRRVQLGTKDQMLPSITWTVRMLSAQVVFCWPDSDLWGRETIPQPKFAIFSVAASLFCKGAAQTCPVNSCRQLKW